MANSKQFPGIVHFGVFEVDLRAGELRRDGLKVRLQEQPFRVLALLIEKPGEVVTREDVREKLWSADTYVDFDKSLNTTVNKLREALGDSAENPRFVQTLHRRGYRFIAPVQAITAESSALGQAPPVGTGTPAGPSPRSGDAEASAASPPSQTIVSGQAQTGSPVPAAEIGARASAQARLAWLVAALCFVALLALAFVHFRETPPEAPVRRFSFSQEGLSAASISPDGRYIAFAVQTGGESSLWLRALESEAAREIPGTDGARPVVSGWSPDSQSIVFATTPEIKRVSIDGGNPITLGQLPGTGPGGFLGVSWSPDGDRIVFSSRGRLWEIPARDGEPRVLLEREGAIRSRTPHFLPTDGGSEGLVYNTYQLGANFDADSRIWVMDLETGERRELVSGLEPIYSPDGYLIYQAAGLDETGLRALPFSLATLEPTGEAFPFPISVGGIGASVSRDGTLVYLDSLTSGQQQLVWRGRLGERIGEIGQPQAAISEPALSPDGKLVAVSASEGSSPGDIWIHDISRSLKTRLSFAPEDESLPVRSPDGKQIAYSHRHSGQSDVVVKPADGSGEAQPLVSTEAREDICDWSADGTRILYEVRDPKTGSDLWYLERKPDGSGYESHPFLQTPFNEQGARFSPDGRFVAYCSNESGEVGVYVRPFPQGGARWQVSSGEGRQPRWRRDGKEIFYVEGDTMIAVSVSTRAGFSVGKAARLFQNPNLPYPSGGFAFRYDVSPDGQRFVLREPVDTEDSQPAIRVVLNWFEEFRDRDRE